MAKDNKTTSSKTTTNASEEATNPKFSQFDAPQTGGVSPADTSGEGVFNTAGNEPVRDKTADPNKGTPVTRFFTKDGTPVEPTTVPPAVTPANLAGQDASKRDDVVAAVEYLDDSGAVLTHDSLKAKQEADKANK